MAAQLGGTPVLILKEGAERKRGRDAQKNNIMAAKIIAESVRSTLGPRGMDKMLVDTLGDVVITNDGATILDEMDVEHPAAKMLVEVAKTQDEEVGDGTTSAVVLAGEFLSQAEELLSQDVHATVIIKGYRMAQTKALEILDGIAKNVEPTDTRTLTNIAMTSMTGKGAEAAREELAGLAVKGIRLVAEEGDDGKYEIDTDHVKIEKKEGGSISDSELIHGILIDKERVHPSMPKRVDKAKIALVNQALEIEKTETDAKINITSPDQLREFLEEEEGMLRKMVDKVKETGASVLLCQKGIDDLAQHYLAKSGILAARRVKESDMEKLGRATGGNVVNSIKELTKDDLGTAGIVEERKIAGDDMIFVENCKNPKAVTILVRGGTEHVVDEIDRALNDAIHVVAQVMENPKIVAGGGSSEIAVVRELDEFAKTIGGREGLAVEAFSKALRAIPRSLGENAGLDPIDTMQDLVAASAEKGPDMGLDVLSGKIKDMYKRNVIEALTVKSQAIKSACDATMMVLRIDDVIASKELDTDKGPPGGEMGPEY
jgi:thermosome